MSASPRSTQPLGRRWTSHHTTAVLSLVLAGLTGLYFWDRHRIGTDEALDRKYQLFDAWRADQISRIEARFGKDTIVMVRTAGEAGGWQVTENGGEVDADEQAVGQYLTKLEFAAQAREIQGLDRTALGLSSPRGVVEVSMGVLHYKLTLGGDAPTPAGASYVEVEGGERGNRQYVLSREQTEALRVAPGQLRSKSLVPYFARDLSSLALDGNGGWKMVRGSWGGRTAAAFMLDAAKDKVRVSRRRLDAWLVALGRLEVERFVDVAPSPAAGSRALELVPTDEGQPAARIEIGGACDGGKLVVRRTPRPAAGCAPALDVDALLVARGELVDHFVLGSAEGDVMELSLRSGEIVVDVARKETGWHMRQPNEGEASGVGPLLAQLVATEGELLDPAESQDLAPLGLAPPRARVRVVAVPERGGNLAVKERIEEVDVGEAVDDWIYVRRRDDGAVLRLARAVGEPWLPRPSLLRSTKIHRIELEQTKSLGIDCDGKEQRLRRTDAGTWTMEEPSTGGLGADQGQANQLARELGALEAVRWVSEKARGHHRLDEPWCHIELETSVKDATVLELELGAETEGGYFARTRAAPAIFVAPKSLAALARGWLLDRTRLVVDRSRITRISLDAPKRSSMALIHRAGGWFVEGGAADTRAESLGAAATELIAERVVGLGPPATDDGFEPARLRMTIHLDAGEPAVIEVGKGDSVGGTSVYLVRMRGVDATFAVARARIQPLLDAL